VVDLKKDDPGPIDGVRGGQSDLLHRCDGVGDYEFGAGDGEAQMAPEVVDDDFGAAIDCSRDKPQRGCGDQPREGGASGSVDGRLGHPIILRCAGSGRGLRPAVSRGSRR
jgi:hypothetical protein